MEYNEKMEKKYDDFVNTNPYVLQARKSKGNNKNEMVNAIYWFYMSIFSLNSIINYISGYNARIRLRKFEKEHFGSTHFGEVKRTDIDYKITDQIEDFYIYEERAVKAFNLSVQYNFRYEEASACWFLITIIQSMKNEIDKLLKDSQLDYSSFIVDINAKLSSIKHDFKRALNDSNLSQDEKESLLKKIEESVQKKKSWIPKGFK